jgi:hypothetical protein
MKKKQNPNFSWILNQESFTLPAVDHLVMENGRLSEAELARLQYSKFR